MEGYFYGSQKGSLPVIDVRVDAAADIADTIRQVELTTSDGRAFPAFAAGDHIEVHLGPDLRRCYSLVGRPGVATHTYRIAVALDAESRGGSKAVHALRVGQALTISAPRSNFPLSPGPAPVVLLAGGIGITPIFTMAHALNAEDRPWELHYAFRAEAVAALLPELSTLAGPHPDRLRLYPDQPSGQPSIDITAVVKAAPPDAELYCCGPAGMLDAFAAATRDLDTARVHIERFTREAPLATGGDALTVRLARSGLTLQVGPEDNILETVLDAGIDVEYSCVEGICDSCRTRVLRGVPDHRDQVLTDQERAEGDTMMICCSRAKGDDIELDL
jgi:tetrachlorobenzoquinone reductase